MIDALRHGTWLTPARLTVYPRLLLAGFAVALAALMATAHGTFDWSGRMLGTDFSEVWAAGCSVLAGHPDRPFDVTAHVATQLQLFGPHDDVYGWLYPPYFLAPATLLACLPYVAAFVLWQAATLPLYLAAVLRILGGSVATAPAVVAALAFPAVFVNIGHGNNGFLTAGLLAGGLILLPRRPIMAGVLFGLLAYKPQFGLLLPLALLAGGHWRTIAAATVTVVAMTLATLGLFGADAWLAFFHGVRFTREVILEQGSPGWYKLQSPFAAVRMLGGSVALAYAVQMVALGAAAAGLAWLWRSGADVRLKSAALLAATVFATPYGFDYEMVVLGPCIACMVAYGRDFGHAPYEKSVLAIAWLVPLLARAVAQWTHVPVGLAVVMLLFAGIIRRGRHECGTLRPRNPAGETSLAAPA